MKNRTKDLILESFNELAQTTSFEKISVGDICKHAEISRNTFYHYFHDKFDVMTYNYEHIFQEKVRSGDIKTPVAFFAAIYQEARDDWGQLARLWEVHGINSISDYIYKVNENYISQLAELEHYTLTPEEVFQTKLLCLGISRLGIEFISGEYEISSQEAAEATWALFPENLKQVFTKAWKERSI